MFDKLLESTYGVSSTEDRTTNSCLPGDVVLIRVGMRTHIINIQINQILVCVMKETKARSKLRE